MKTSCLSLLGIESGREAKSRVNSLCRSLTLRTISKDSWPRPASDEATDASNLLNSLRGWPLKEEAAGSGQNRSHVAELDTAWGSDLWIVSNRNTGSRINRHGLEPKLLWPWPGSPILLNLFSCLGSRVILHIQACIRDIVGLVPGHCNKANMATTTKKWVMWIIWFPSACKGFPQWLSR